MYLVKDIFFLELFTVSRFAPTLVVIIFFRNITKNYQ